MPIIEKRIFSPKGKMMLRSLTPEITDLREYRDELRPHIIRMRVKRYDGQRGVFFELDDYRMIIVILGKEVEAMAATNAPTVDHIERAIAAD
jgi:hypothetical protein